MTDLVLGAGTNTIPRIETMYAFLSVDPRTGNEGIIAGMVPGGPQAPGFGTWVTLCTAQERLLPAMKVIAARTIAGSGRKVRLVKFTGRDDMETIG